MTTEGKAQFVLGDFVQLSLFNNQRVGLVGLAGNDQTHYVKLEPRKRATQYITLVDSELNLIKKGKYQVTLHLQQQEEEETDK